MDRLVLEFSVRAALIATSAALVLLALRIRSAAAQHAVWTGVLVSMLALPLWIAWGPKASLPLLPSQPVAASQIGAAPVPLAPYGQAIAPFPTPALPPTLPASNWRPTAIRVYAFVAIALLLRLAIGTLRSRALTESSCSAPITVGLFRPRILLPGDSREWPPAQRAAVLSHESAHARRRDPLVQWLALLNRALFWFHPLAWWLERRLGALAEDACDAAVLAAGHDAAEYSAFLVDLARTIQHSGARINAIGVAMPGSGLPRRIPRILSGAVISPVSSAKKAAAALACALCAATFAAATVRRASHPTPFLAQVAAADRPKFEVASIRPCKESDITQGGKGTKNKKGGRGGGGRFRGSPGSLIAECQPVENLIRSAYLGYPDGKPWPVDKNIGIPMPPLPDRVFNQEIKGPGWISSDRFTIEAKAPTPAPMEMMRGPMMQTLLEDRFRLKIRIEQRDLPVYFLTVDGEPKLQPTKDGTCMSFAELDQRYRTEPPKPSEKLIVCGMFHPIILDRNANVDRAVSNRAIGVDTSGQTLADLCRQFSTGADREIIDHTGLTDKYDIHLDLAMQDLFPSGPGPHDPDELPPSPEEKTAHIAAAVRKLGLKLEPGKSSAPFVVIDHVERPSEN